MTPAVFISDSVAETRAHAAHFAAGATAGMILRLHGDLGAGKTTWMQGFVAGLKSADTVTSPTFSLLHEYHGKLPVYHWDLYRLGTETNWDLLDLPEHLPSKDGVTVIEWSERYPGPWPDSGCWDIHIKIDADDQREIRISKP